MHAKKQDARLTDGKSVMRIEKQLLKDFKAMCGASETKPEEKIDSILRKWIKEEARARYAL